MQLCLGLASLILFAFAHADAAVGRDDDGIEKLDADELTGVGQDLHHFAVFAAGCRVARRMVMYDYDGCCGISYRWAEHFTRMN